MRGIYTDIYMDRQCRGITASHVNAYARKFRSPKIVWASLSTWEVAQSLARVALSSAILRLSAFYEFSISQSLRPLLTLRMRSIDSAQCVL